ncbi:MAG: glycosyltransferase family 39 protein [Candidatus Helarchaeota archaeon]
MGKYFAERFSFNFMPEFNKKINNTSYFFAKPFDFIPSKKKAGLYPPFAIGYSLILSLFYLIAGVKGMSIATPLFTTLAVYLTYLLCEREFGAKQAILASLLLAFNPILLKHAVWHMAHSTMIFFLLSTYYFFPKNKLFAGVSFSISLLVRHETIFFIIPLFLREYNGLRNLSQTLKKFKKFLIGFLPLFLFKLGYNFFNFGLKGGYGTLYSFKGLMIGIFVSFIRRFIDNSNLFIKTISLPVFILSLLQYKYDKKKIISILLTTLIFLMFFSIYPIYNRNLTNIKEIWQKFLPIKPPHNFYFRVFIPLAPFYFILASDSAIRITKNKKTFMIILLLVLPQLTQSITLPYFREDKTSESVLILKELEKVLEPNSVLIIAPGGYDSRIIFQGTYVMMSKVYALNTFCEFNNLEIKKDFLFNLTKSFEKIYVIGNKTECEPLEDFDTTLINESLSLYEVRT